MTALEELLAGLAAPGQPDATYRALDAALRDAIGHKLFTLLVVAPGGAEVERVYSSDPDAYPVGGRKRMGPTPWGDHVLVRGRPWRGDGPEDMAWAFPDHALIARLGLGSVINVPIRYDGVTLGTMAALDAEGAYDDAALATAASLAPALIPAFLGAR